MTRQRIFSHLICFLFFAALFINPIFLNKVQGLDPTQPHRYQVSSRISPASLPQIPVGRLSQLLFDFFQENLEITHLQQLITRIQNPDSGFRYVNFFKRHERKLEKGTECSAVVQRRGQEVFVFKFHLVWGIYTKNENGRNQEDLVIMEKVPTRNSDNKVSSGAYPYRFSFIPPLSSSSHVRPIHTTYHSVSECIDCHTAEASYLSKTENKAYLDWRNNVNQRQDDVQRISTELITENTGEYH